jgi:predicted MPP superfamily phosphohydrolase
MVSRTEKNKIKRKKIIKEEKKETRKKVLNVTIKIVLWLFIICSILFFILRYAGNYGLVVKENAVISATLPENFHGTKIIHFTDLHYGTSIKTKELQKIVKKINDIKPDLIIFTGDLVDKHYSITKKEFNELKEQLSNLTASLGKYAVQGNHDQKHFNDIMKDTDFLVLDNNYDLIYKDNNTPILITGLGSSLLKNMDIDKAYSYFNEDNSNQSIYTISLLHEPDSIDAILENYKVDLALAGHSHNGQVRLPFTPALVKVLGAKKYYEAEYEINDTKLYVSGGIGTSKYPFRLFNHPSINLIRLRQY